MTNASLRPLPGPGDDRLGTSSAGRLVVLLFALAVAACAETRSFELVEGSEDPIFLDDLPGAERGYAVGQIGDALRRGTEVYRLAVGDRLEVTFHIDRLATQPYRIAVGDELEIDFLYNSDANRTVVVRPDGMISLPGKGEIRAVGQTPLALGRRISQIYADVFVDPTVTVFVRRFTMPADDLNEVVRTAAEGRARAAVVGPDGMIDLPLASRVRAAGRTVTELQEALDPIYARTIGNVRTTVRLTALGANQIFVFGEVRQPGPIAAPTPRTAMQAVAAAGGPLPTAAFDQVRVLYFDPAGRARVRQINLDSLVSNGRFDQDMLVPPNSTVFVPPSALAKVGRFIDQTIRQIFLFNGVSVGINYELNRNRN